MAFATGQRDLVPALTLRAAHDPDGLLLVFQDRALLDMRLEIGGRRPVAAALALVAYALQLAAQRVAVAVLDGERFLVRGNGRSDDTLLLQRAHGDDLHQGARWLTQWLSATFCSQLWPVGCAI